MKLKKNMSAVGHHTSHPTKLSQHLAVDNCTDTIKIYLNIFLQETIAVFLCVWIYISCF